MDDGHGAVLADRIGADFQTVAAARALGPLRCCLDRPNRFVMEQRLRAAHHVGWFRRDAIAGLREPACSKIDSRRVLAQGSTASARFSNTASRTSGIVFDVAS